MHENLIIRLLAECKQYIPELALLWIAELGADSDPPADIKNVKQRFIDHCHKDKLPLAYVAACQDKPIGMACLRITEGIQDNLTPWLGGLVVHPDYRRKKVGEKLVSEIKKHAKKLGYSKLYLLSDDTLSAWYIRLDWKKIGVCDHDPDITIMSIDLL